MGECVNGCSDSGHAFALPITTKFIMLPNEKFALACREWYAEQGLVVDKTNGEFAHCPYPESMGDTGYYLLHEHHQHQGILQSKDVDRCCFFPGYAKKWLLECKYWPDNYLELWDIYEKYTEILTSESGRKSAIKRNAENPHYWDKTLGKYLKENPNHARDVARKIKEKSPDHFVNNYKKTLGILQEDKEAYSEMCRKNFLARLEADPEYQSRTFQKLLEKNPNHQSEAAQKRWEVNPDKTQIISLGTDKWFDPDHPELGEHNAGVLTRKQKKLGYPHGKENRKRVG